MKEQMLMTYKTLVDNNLTPNEFFVLYCLHLNIPRHIGDVFAQSPEDTIPNILDSLVEKRYVKRLPEKRVIILQKGIDLFKTNTNESDFIVAYRNLFDKKNINGVIGKKGDRQNCINNMHEFMKKNPKYTEDIILKAAKLYIESERHNHNFKYLQRADYVIFKKDGKSKLSRLEMYCEEVLSGASVDDGEDLFTTNV